jgi:hypothetical protein
MKMGIIVLCFNGGEFHSMYSCWLLPHSYEGNPVQLCSDSYLVAVYFSRVMVVGSMSWHQNISRIGLRVAITLIYMLYDCWVI